jgi:hypothetical protein
MRSREFDACARSYGVSACKLISQRMFETLPRELRDLVYDDIVLDVCMTVAQTEVDSEENSHVSAWSSYEALQGVRSTTLLDRRFSFLKRHYFQASYMGVEFVKELINTYFRKIPFKVRAEDLFARNGQQEFFLLDKFRLGCLLGDLLGHVEVLITSLQSRLADMLQPLMAIRNTDCIVELTAPNVLTTMTYTYGREATPATSQELLDALALSLRRMKYKGFYIIMKYQGTIILEANKREDRRKNRKPILVGLRVTAIGTLQLTHRRTDKLAL